ncbi:DUF2750 domain-containing protein [Candidatus Clostridium stratigraminis]|uniref:DUF2750 domain-containing protein n=1 Tax=Candidatus Clostridium stratigraminis TaxID=3381661 RepID=A0ABW8T1F2_9CLOT
MNYSEVEDIFCLTEDRKYKYFFNKVAESEQVCGLKDKNGFITTKDEKGRTAMPLWPSYDFAKYCQENQWKETQIEAIDLYELLEYWLDGMKKDGCRVLVFADTGGGGISVDALELKDELQHFLSTNS